MLVIVDLIPVIEFECWDVCCWFVEWGWGYLFMIVVCCSVVGWCWGIVVVLRSWWCFSDYSSCICSPTTSMSWVRFVVGWVVTGTDWWIVDGWCWWCWVIGCIVIWFGFIWVRIIVVAVWGEMSAVLPVEIEFIWVMIIDFDGCVCTISIYLIVIACERLLIILFVVSVCVWFVVVIVHAFVWVIVEFFVVCWYDCVIVVCFWFIEDVFVRV